MWTKNKLFDLKAACGRKGIGEVDHTHSFVVSFKGVQMVGEPETLVAKRIDTAAAALFAHSTVDQLNDLDLSYSPPVNSPGIPCSQVLRLGRSL